jgi:hypothetical protein
VDAAVTRPPQASAIAIFAARGAGQVPTYCRGMKSHASTGRSVMSAGSVTGKAAGRREPGKWC